MSNTKYVTIMIASIVPYESITVLHMYLTHICTPTHLHDLFFDNNNQKRYESENIVQVLSFTVLQKNDWDKGI